MGSWGERVRTNGLPARRSSAAASWRRIEVAALIRFLSGPRKHQPEISPIRLLFESASRGKGREKRTHLTGNGSVGNPPSISSTYAAAALPNMAGRGPRTGRMRTRKLAIALSSSTLPRWNSSSGRGRRPMSVRGFSVEYWGGEGVRIRWEEGVGWGGPRRGCRRGHLGAFCEGKRR